MHPYSLIYMESRNNQSYTATVGPHGVGASNTIDKLLRTDGKQAFRWAVL